MPAEKPRARTATRAQAISDAGGMQHPTDLPRYRWGLIALFLLISVGGTYLAMWMRPQQVIPTFTYELLKTRDHDPSAFTQGLVVEDGIAWESTGLLGESTIRKVDFESRQCAQESRAQTERIWRGADQDRRPTLSADVAK